MRLMCGSIVQLTIAISCEPAISSFSFSRADAADQVVPVDVLERLVLAEHQLAVLELQRIGVPRLADADDAAPSWRAPRRRGGSSG